MSALARYAKWLFRLSRGVRGALVVNVFLGLVLVGFDLVFVALCKRIIDLSSGTLAVADRGTALLWAGGALLGLIPVRLLTGAASTWVENMASARLNFLLRQRLYGELMQTRWFGRERFHTGDALNRLMTDVDSVTKVICAELPELVTTVAQMLAAAGFMALLDWRLALIILFVTPVFVLLSKVFFSRMRILTRDIRNTESRVQSHIQESLQQKTLIQSMERSDMMEEQLERLQGEELEQVVRRTRFHVFSRTVITATFQLGYAASFLWGAHGIFAGTLTFGMMTAFLQLVGRVQHPAMRLSRQIPVLANATASMDRLMELEEMEKEERGEALRLPGVAGVRLEGVSFRYPDGDRDVLSKVDFDFPPGSRTAIVGETGVGKSTLIKLILNLLRPTQGRIVLYGEGVEAEASPRTRCNLVYVPQGNTLLSGTVRDNLLLGNPDATEEQLLEALSLAAADFVRTLPGGLDAPCGERGAGLSEGQAQRIAIARALLRPGSILLLDEFSSSLDPETEDRLMRNLTSQNGGPLGAMASNTMIFITHRERISEYCDRQLRLGPDAPAQS